jgi:hypothetical protein
MLPPLAVILALLYQAVSLAGAPPFPVFWLPVVLLAAPLAGLLATELGLRLRGGLAGTAAAAHACDERFALKDRLSAAWEFGGLPRPPSGMEAAAMEDGRARLGQIDPAAVKPGRPALRLPLGRLLLAVAICLLPALLPGRAATDTPPAAGATAGAELPESGRELPVSKAAEPAAAPQPAVRPPPLRHRRAPRPAARRVAAASTRGRHRLRAATRVRPVPANLRPRAAAAGPAASRRRATPRRASRRRPRRRTSQRASGRRSPPSSARRRAPTNRRAARRPAGRRAPAGAWPRSATSAAACRAASRARSRPRRTRRRSRTRTRRATRAAA